MLVHMKKLLEEAEKKIYAVGCFNCPTLENVYAVIRAAETCNRSVILSFPQVHENTIPLRVMGPILLNAAKDASVQVCVHLDHADSLDYIQKALELGFPSVMYDGSALSFEENVKNSKAVVQMAHEYGAEVEAELGGISGEEAGISSGHMVETKLTDVEEAVSFVRETNIDFLAPSIGTAHGFYEKVPHLDFERISAIHEKTKIPLVLHGGSGISEEDYRTVIDRGMRKINYYSYMAKAGADGVKQLFEKKNVKYFHDIALTAMDSMEADVRKAIILFANYKTK